MTWFAVKLPEKGWYAVKQNNQPISAQLAGTVEYTDCISAEE